MSAEAARPSRRRYWTAAQLLNWILFRTGRSVDLAARVKAPGVPDGPSAGAMLALVTSVIDSPYLRKSGEGVSVADISIAEDELRSAVAAGKLASEDAGLFDRAAVKAFWPGKGRGNAAKPAMNAKQVNRLASAIRCLPRTEALARSETSDRGPRGMLLRTVGLTIDNKEDRRDLFRAAIRVAIGQLVLCRRSRAPLKNEALERLGHTERRRQMGSVLSWRGKRVLGPAN